MVNLKSLANGQTIPEWVTPSFSSVTWRLARFPQQREGKDEKVDPQYIAVHFYMTTHATRMFPFTLYSVIQNEYIHFAPFRVSVYTGCPNCELVDYQIRLWNRSDHKKIRHKFLLSFYHIIFSFISLRNLLKGRKHFNEFMVSFCVTFFLHSFFKWKLKVPVLDLSIPVFRFHGAWKLYKSFHNLNAHIFLYNELYERFEVFTHLSWDISNTNTFQKYFRWRRKDGSVYLRWEVHVGSFENRHSCKLDQVLPPSLFPDFPWAWRSGSRLVFIFLSFQLEILPLWIVLLFWLLSSSPELNRSNSKIALEN